MAARCPERGDGWPQGAWQFAAATASSQAVGFVRPFPRLAPCCPAAFGHPVTVAPGAAMATGSGRHKSFTHRYVPRSLPMRAFPVPALRHASAVGSPALGAALCAASARDGFSWG
ncbi:hypothetical protein GCM10010284_58640 [Streptomyces rubiginosohelvolus]|uniref:Uncharacterized protein n=1 Tax=Streptomyces rubiginosohelvolus TaxID=67362 RepID=A0ABQ3BCG2_9ACTN|nr:hypothetical protein GCM10010284_58640 [Streptomyces rubiginosohelvolus]GGZ34896.1 hypothetical protein GCM10010328_05240 [Streptomyces pluricolorescens]